VLRLAGKLWGIPNTIEFISEQFIINGMKYNKNVNIGIIISLLSLTERNSIFEILIKL
jgi:hypothetical protein